MVRDSQSIILETLHEAKIRSAIVRRKPRRIRLWDSRIFSGSFDVTLAAGLLHRSGTQLWTASKSPRYIAATLEALIDPQMLRTYIYIPRLKGLSGIIK